MTTAQKLGDVVVAGTSALIWCWLRGISRKTYEKEHISSPAIITGIVESKMLRRPTWSIISRANRVQIKLVPAIDKEVKVGEEKPTREKIVAEKYIREFYNSVSWKCESLRVI